MKNPREEILSFLKKRAEINGKSSNQWGMNSQTGIETAGASNECLHIIDWLERNPDLFQQPQADQNYKALYEQAVKDRDYHKDMWNGQINRTKLTEAKVEELKTAMRNGWYCVVVRGRGEDEVEIFDYPPHGCDVRARQHPDLAQYFMETSPVDDAGRMIESKIRPVLDSERLTPGMRIIFVPTTVLYQPTD